MSDSQSPEGAAKPLLELRDLATWFHTDEGTAKAVDGVSYKIYPGETLGLVGTGWAQARP